MKVTLWSRLIRIYHKPPQPHDSSPQTFHRVPTAQLGKQQKGLQNKPLALRHSQHLLKNSAVVCAMLYLSYYPIRYASFTVQTKYESTTQLQLRGRDRDQPLLAVVLTNQCLFFSLWSVITCLLCQQAFKITSCLG